MGLAVAVLKKNEGRTLKSGGSWVYDNEVDSVTGNFEDGDVVLVRDFDGYPMGRGFINRHSKIMIRMMTRDADQETDSDFLRMRLQAAWDYRKMVVDTSCCRIVFGEADFLPGLVVDKYSDVLVIQVSALGMDRMKDDAADILRDILKQDGIIIRGIYERSDGRYRDQEGAPRIKRFIGEPFDTNVEINENGIRYLVDIENGQKTGFFLDQKFNRLAVRNLCTGAKVLDCFTHTGSFALNAALAGASSVLGIDASESAIEQAEKNARLNGVEDIVTFECADVFEFLPALEEEGENYDLVILDPPAFTKSKNSVKQASKGYREINRRGISLVKNGGFIATCSCSHFITDELFREILNQSAAAAHRRIRQVYCGTQSPDHPVLWNVGDSSYLKFYILQVLDERRI